MEYAYAEFSLYSMPAGMKSLCVCRGQVIKGQEAVVRSRYDEDVFPGNHSSVWGSYWADGKWGYACCKSHLKNSLCMGDRVEQVAQQRQQSRDTAQDKAAVRDELADGKSDDAANGASNTGTNTALHIHWHLLCCRILMLDFASCWCH